MEEQGSVYQLSNVEQALKNCCELTNVTCDKCSMSLLCKAGIDLMALRNAILETIDAVSDAISNLAENLAEIIVPVISSIVERFSHFDDSHLRSLDPKAFHLYKHSKKLRVRKKNYNRLLKLYTAEMAGEEI